MNQDHVIKATRQWIETVVIDLNLCPFAKREIVNDNVRFAVTEADTEEQLLMDLHIELDHMYQDATVETTLVIHPNVLGEFAAYNLFLSLTDALLVQMNHDGVFQIASFHPDYQFAGTNAGDPENYTNKSPFPMLHILREASLDNAIASHPDIHAVPPRNQKLMRELGPTKMQALLRACFDAKP